MEKTDYQDFELRLLNDLSSNLDNVGDQFTSLLIECEGGIRLTNPVNHWRIAEFLACHTELPNLLKWRWQTWMVRMDRGPREGTYVQAHKTLYSHLPLMLIGEALAQLADYAVNAVMREVEKEREGTPEEEWVLQHLPGLIGIEGKASPTDLGNLRNIKAVSECLKAQTNMNALERSPRWKPERS